MGTATATPGSEPAQLGGKYLTFFLGGEEYGLGILKVQEIIRVMPITAVPRTPAHLRGVVNLRGKVIAIVDLRRKFGMESTEEANENCIVVVQAGGVQMGVVVDRVSEVVDIPAENIEQTPSFGADVDCDYIVGIGKANGKVKLLLDIDRALSEEDVAPLEVAAEL